MQNHMRIPAILFIIFFMGSVGLARAGSSVYGNQIYDPGQLKPVDSKLKVKIGRAPDFTLPSILGTFVRLSSYLGKKNIMLTFVPAAWTPVCSSQWPGYVLAHDLFAKYNTRVIGISTDNVPTLFAWTRDMGKV